MWLIDWWSRLYRLDSMKRMNQDYSWKARFILEILLLSKMARYSLVYRFRKTQLIYSYLQYYLLRIDPQIILQSLITYIMNEEEDEFFVQPQVEELKDIQPLTDQLPPSSKPSTIAPKPHLKMVEIPRQPEYHLYRPFRLQLHQSQQEQEQAQTQFKCQCQFTEFYSPAQLIYQRHDNNPYNRFNNTTYYAGQFVPRSLLADSKCNQTHEIAQIMQEYYDLYPPNLRKDEKQLIFDSKFECGNLFAAYKVSQTEYDLVMSNDTNSTGNNQWFYFTVQGMKPNKEYTFSIINFTKADSLFNYGMGPAIYSQAENKHSNLERGWRRGGKDITYKRGKLPRQNSRRMYYRLSFKLSTSFQFDKLSVAHSYPYTLQKLNHFISDKKYRYKDFVEKIQIGKTIAKRPIEGLVICYPINKKRDNRKAIVVMARQHPGQTQGSYVCEGVVDRLLLKTKQSQFLLRNYVFYVIPMVNPDGVVFGHYRTNLAGKDLNRKWNASDKDANCPEVIAIKNFLTDLHSDRQIRFILDLHGHSKKLNSFFYGNPFADSPQAVRIYPFVCSKLHSGIQYLDCTFATEELKRKAARVYLSYLYKNIHVYTFESSFYAFEKQGKTIEFTPKQYRQLGSTLVSGLFHQLQHQSKYQQSTQFNLKKFNTKQYLSSTFVKYLIQLKNSKLLMSQGTLQQSGSESKVDEGQINIEDVEYSKIMKIDTPSLPVDKQSISKSLKFSRKGTTQIREYPYSRPTRNLRVLETSKINSVLPDKYQFCLQPIKKKDASQAIIKLKAIQAVAESQTQSFKNEIRLLEYPESQIKNTNLSRSFFPVKPEDRKCVSLIKSLHHRNNVIFKLDIIANTSRNMNETQKSTQIIHKHAFSQTMLSFARANQKSRHSQIFPQLQLADKDQSLQWWPKSTQVRLETPLSSVILKKQAEGYLNGMVKKFVSGKESRNCEEITRKHMMDKNFSIKRKQLHKK